jgi:hypothetical protein
MAFELGLGVAWFKTKGRAHRWFPFKAVAHRAAKPLSDLEGTDAYIHHGTPRGAKGSRPLTGVHP